MAEYELRLLNKNKGTVLIYKLACLGDAHAEAVISTMRNVPFSYYEIWKGMEKIAEAPRPIYGSPANETD